MEIPAGDRVLRPWREGDEPALVKYANNRNVWINLKDLFPHPYTMEDAEAWVQSQKGPRPSDELRHRQRRRGYRRDRAQAAERHLQAVRRGGVLAGRAVLGAGHRHPCAPGVDGARLRHLRPRPTLRHGQGVEPGFGACAGEVRVHAGGAAATQLHQGWEDGRPAPVRARPGVGALPRLDSGSKIARYTRRAEAQRWSTQPLSRRRRAG